MSKDRELILRGCDHDDVPVFQKGLVVARDLGMCIIFF